MGGGAEAEGQLLSSPLSSMVMIHDLRSCARVKLGREFQPVLRRGNNWGGYWPYMKTDDGIRCRIQCTAFWMLCS